MGDGIQILNGRRAYEPDGIVLARYLKDRSPVSIIRGPIGSGTSSASCMKIWMIASEQVLFEGRRRTKAIIVRNTYGELRDTTMKTWLRWFPEEMYGTVFWSRPMRHEVRVGDIELDVYFLALDGAEDIATLRSLEPTLFWFNEIEFQRKALVDEAQSRCRWPSRGEGGSNYYGVIGDMNAPTSDNWIVQMTGEAALPEEMPEDEKRAMVWPATWGYFVQPPAVLDVFAPDGRTLMGYRVNAKAENLRWLPKGYYENMIPGKTRQFLRSRLQNIITFHMDGDPVWPMWNDEDHLAPSPLEPVEGYDVWVSLDFGRRPTAIMAQRISETIQVQFEFRMFGAGSSIFAPALKRFLAAKYPGGKWRFRYTGDPKGQDRGQADERTSYEIFETHGIKVVPAPVKNNHMQTRVEVVVAVLTAKRGLSVSPVCTTLVAGMRGGYHIKKNAAGDPDPVKDKYSDPADCLQYLCLSMGEGRKMIGLDPEKGKGPVKVSKGRRDLRRVA